MEINDIFNRMDEWRHLPYWQLERRADLFFSLYLKTVFYKQFGVTIKDTIIPEFPLRIETKNDEKPTTKDTAIPEIPLLVKTENVEKQTNRTNKVDYAVFADEEKGVKCYLIELKTDMKSIDPEQLEYLEKAEKKTISTLIDELKPVFKRTNEKWKYVNLFTSLDTIGLVECKFLQNENRKFGKHKKWGKIIDDIVVQPYTTNPTIVYIQPLQDNEKTKKPETFKTINFEEFTNAISGYNDSLTKRFRQSISKWIEKKPWESK